VPIVAAASTNDDGHPMRVKVNQIAGFTCKAITAWALTNLAPGCDVRSDGLAGFAGVIAAGRVHSFLGAFAYRFHRQVKLAMSPRHLVRRATVTALRANVSSWVWLWFMNNEAILREAFKFTSLSSRKDRKCQAQRKSDAHCNAEQLYLPFWFLYFQQAAAPFPARSADFLS
jgi:hypothetical protein